MLCMEGALFRALVGSGKGENVQKACCAASSAVALAAWLTVVLQPKQCGERGLGCCAGRVFEFRGPFRGIGEALWLGLLSATRTLIYSIEFFAGHRRERQRSIAHTICAGSCHI